MESKVGEVGFSLFMHLSGVTNSPLCNASLFLLLIVILKPRHVRQHFGQFPTGGSPRPKRKSMGLNSRSLPIDNLFV